LPKIWLAQRARSEAPTIATDAARNMLAGERNTLSLPATLAPHYAWSCPVWYRILPRPAMLTLATPTA
jgi:hypothetical protein